jgi:hypothetical protein
MVAGLLVPSCGPGQDHRRCSGPHPDFVVLIKLSDRPLPPDTVVKVLYGGSGTETYDLASPNRDPEVLFCAPAGADCSALPDGASAVGAAGAAGSAGEDASVEALRCELWTGGFATVTVQGTGLTDPSYDLTPDDKVCTVSRCLKLDSPDGG